MNWGMIGNALKAVIGIGVSIPVLLRGVYEWGRYSSAKEIFAIQKKLEENDKKIEELQAKEKNKEE